MNEDSKKSNTYYDDDTENKRNQLGLDDSLLSQDVKRSSNINGNNSSTKNLNDVDMVYLI